MIQFKVWGALRYLSHAEMLRLFQRACVRAGINVRYSQGFNPRPRLSLPLPRPVGVESDDEVLSLRVNKDNARRGLPHYYQAGGKSPALQKIESKLSAQLPEGCELLSVNVAESAASIQPRSAIYFLPVRPEYLNDALRVKINRLLSSESLTVRRKIGAGGRKVKNIDVRPFLTSIEMKNDGIIVECKVGPDGSIRVDEVLSLLELDHCKLAGPVKRTKVQWK